MTKTSIWWNSMKFISKCENSLTVLLSKSLSSSLTPPALSLSVPLFLLHSLKISHLMIVFGRWPKWTYSLFGWHHTFSIINESNLKLFAIFHENQYSFILQTVRRFSVVCENDGIPLRSSLVVVFVVAVVVVFVQPSSPFLVPKMIYLICQTRCERRKFITQKLKPTSRRFFVC